MKIRKGKIYGYDIGLGFVIVGYCVKKHISKSF
jgi:hypothetical protein